MNSMQLIRSKTAYLLEMAKLKKRRSYGLNFLDHRLAEIITKRNGFFVEAGGNDGLCQSNTMYFERYMGWTGLLVEPIPKLAERAVRNRPKSIVEQCALVPFGYDQKSIMMTYCNLMSYVDGARGSVIADEEHLRIAKRYLTAEDEVEKVEVKCRTLTDVIVKNKIAKIDLLSLDVEGFEAQVLNGLDFARFSPDWILVEANTPDEIDQILGPYYDPPELLSHHDRLYRLKK